ncbi:hypothetical protein [Candidatus Williamhamiltonella defendens]|uniref:hypothetical protein n=1 Tax=Candidatus Williamhamiltonella defendens TaxID=138072 RepID=UPI00165116F7|nr:hypothetical protein [Candidatus Hamiltonella defensa]
MTFAGGDNIANELAVGTLIQMQPNRLQYDKMVITSGNLQAFVMNGDWIGLWPRMKI